MNSRIGSVERPNIILVQADQLAARALGAYGNGCSQTPTMDALADDGVVFERAGCNSPLCAPSRASMLTGQLPSAIGAYDNASDFGTSVPTFAHHLRREGYRTALIGRMHLIGPDQQHGFDERLTTDVYPATFDMVPDWSLDAGDRLPWYHNAESVLNAGVATATVQRDFDEEVTFRSLRYLADRARDPSGQPFCMVTSFIHPHDPYEPPAEQWHRYDGVELDAPRVPTIPWDEQDPHSRRLLAMCGLDRQTPTDEQVARARRAYYASVTFVDDQIGRLVRRLDELGLRDNTVVVVTSDHGDMLGERGLWYKMSPFEGSARVPLIVHAPGRLRPGRVGQVVSLVDLAPSLVEIAGGAPPAGDGRSWWPLARQETSEAPGAAVIEYLAEGVSAPHLTLVRGALKLTVCPGDPDQLFNLADDPDELRNLAGEPGWASVREELRAALLAGRDVDGLRDRVRASQDRRRLIAGALAVGLPTAWDHEHAELSSARYVRGDFWGALERGRLTPADLGATGADAACSATPTASRAAARVEPTADGEVVPLAAGGVGEASPASAQGGRPRSRVA